MSLQGCLNASEGGHGEQDTEQVDLVVLSEDPR